MSKNIDKIRGFEVVELKHYKGIAPFFDEVKEPVRADDGSAGYDFFACEDKMLEPGEQHVFWTNVKAYMLKDEVLMVYPRSSLGTKAGVVLSNTVGVIDSSYYSNPDNDGNIGICLKNTGKIPVLIQYGDRIAQGVFQKYLVADNDNILNPERLGGFGKSGK